MSSKITTQTEEYTNLSDSFRIYEHIISYGAPCVSGNFPKEKGTSDHKYKHLP